MQLIVVGMHRSGTSVLARLLNMMGAYFAPEGVGTGANQENPKGFWERRDVRRLNDYVLFSLNRDWNRISGFALQNVDSSTVSEFRKRASALVLGMDAHRPWMMKEPRLCLLLPLWREVLEVPICLHIIRHPVEVAASLNVRNGIPIQAGLELWELYNELALEGMSGLTTITVFHDSLVQNPEQVAGETHDRLVALGVSGLRMPTPREIGAFVSKEMYRQRRERADLVEYEDCTQVRLFEAWKQAGEAAGQGREEASHRQFDALRAYEATLPPLDIADPKAVLSEDKDHKVAKYEQEIRYLQALHEQSRETIAQTRNQIDFLQREIQRSQSTIVELSGSAEQERRQMTEAIARERERVIALSSDVASGEGQIALLSREVERLEQELKKSKEDATARVRKVRSEAEDLSSQLAERFHEIACLTRMLETEEEAHRQTMSERAEIAGRCASLERQLGKEMIDVRRLQAEKQALERRKGDLDALAATLRAELDAATVCMEEEKAFLQSLFKSRGWRVAGLARRLKRMVSGSPPPQVAFAADVMRIRRSEYFDLAWYLATNEDVAMSCMEPATHYLLYGGSEGRDPGPHFSSAGYLARNPDVAESGVNPLLHYLMHGVVEGRNPGGTPPSVNGTS